LEKKPSKKKTFRTALIGKQASGVEKKSLKKRKDRGGLIGQSRDNRARRRNDNARKNETVPKGGRGQEKKYPGEHGRKQTPHGLEKKRNARRRKGTTADHLTTSRGKELFKYKDGSSLGEECCKKEILGHSSERGT